MSRALALFVTSTLIAFFWTASATSLHAQSGTYIYKGKVTSLAPNFFRENSVTVGCFDGCTGTATVNPDGTFSIVRISDASVASEWTETLLTYHVTNKLSSTVPLYNQACNGFPERFVGSQPVYAVYHPRVAGTYTVEDFYFVDRDIKATAVSVLGPLRQGPKVMKRGARARVKAQVDNVGSETIGEEWEGPFGVEIYLLNGSSFASSSQRILLGAFESALLSGDQDKRIVRVRIPRNLKTGTYYLGVQADRQGYANQCYRNPTFDPGAPADNDHFVWGRAINVVE